MINTNKSVITKNKSILLNRLLYAAFVLLAVYYLMPGRLAEAVSNLGIALIFDPFDQTISWSNRPRYQRAWLVMHLSIVFILIGLLLVRNLM